MYSDFCIVDSRRKRKGVSPKLESNWVGPFEVLTAYPNKTYRLKDYKDVVNESRLKLYHAVDATALEILDDRQGISKFKPDIPSVEDKRCEDIVRSDGAQCNVSDDQQTFSAGKQKRFKRKQLIIENSGGVGGQESPNKSKFSQSTDRCVGRPTDIEKGELKYNSPCISNGSPNMGVDQGCPRKSTRDKKTPIRLG